MSAKNSALEPTAVRALTRSGSRLFGYEGLRFLGLVVFLAVATIVGLFPANLYVESLIALGGVYVIALVGQNIVFGMTGQMVFSQTFFMAVGAYMTYITYQRSGLPFLVCALVGLGSCAVIALVVGVMVIRLEGFYLAAATLMLPFIVPGIALMTTSLSGGLGGFGGIKSPIAQGNGYTLMVLLVAAVVCWSVQNLASFGPGWHWRAIRENERAARSVGLTPATVKLGSFVLASTLGGVAGLLMAPLFGFVSPQTFDISQELLLLFASVLGGMASVSGGIVGAVVLVVLTHVTASTGQWAQVIFGVVLVVVLAMFPDGIAGGIPRLLARFFKTNLAVFGTRMKLREHLGPLKPLSAVLAPAVALSGNRSSAAGDPVGAASTPTDSAARSARRRVGSEPNGTANGMSGVASHPEADSELRCDGVTVTFGGVTAVQSVDLEVPSGRVTGLIGPNGAGKSTLLDVLSGYRAPDRGSVTLDGDRISLLAPEERARRGVSRVFQGREVFGLSTVIDNVATAVAARDRVRFLGSALRLSGTVRHEAEAYRGASTALDRVQARHDVLLSSMGNLPFGAQRTVEFARSIAVPPRFLLLDEPAGGLDDAELDVLTGLIRDMRSDGVGVLIVEHKIGFLREICDRLVVLDHGSVIATGEPSEVLGRPEVLRAYFGEGAG